jgi:hypothetical protein
MNPYRPVSRRPFGGNHLRLRLQVLMRSGPLCPMFQHVAGRLPPVHTPAHTPTTLPLRVNNPSLHLPNLLLDPLLARHHLMVVCLNPDPKPPAKSQRRLIAALEGPSTLQVHQMISITMVKHLSCKGLSLHLPCLPRHPPVAPARPQHPRHPPLHTRSVVKLAIRRSPFQHSKSTPRPGLVPPCRFTVRQAHPCPSAALLRPIAPRHQR